VTKRHFDNWLTAFIDHASFTEAPKHMHFWTGVSTIAGALRRKCWINQVKFKWYPNFYVVIVAPPGIVSKSTTAGIGMDLLRLVPGVKFGPEIVTWQALATSFVNAAETFEYQGLHHVQSALTIESSEFGNLLNPQDKEMVDILVSLWDGKGIKKETKHSGNDEIINPWINLIACTTPSWIASNFPEYLIGGGLTSRMIFVYADTKAKLVPYLDEVSPPDHEETKQKLIEDLEQITMACVGEFKLTPEARRYGKAWYTEHYEGERPKNLDDDRFGGYFARKQTHIHKLAMVLSAAQRSDMLITLEDIELANTMVTDLEPDMAMVFSKIGKTDESFYADRIINFVQRQGEVPYKEVFRFIHSQFPSLRDFEDIFTGLLRAEYLVMFNKDGVPTVKPAK
jgi:hypothetical protein